jgi:hypothetical protein
MERFIWIGKRCINLDCVVQFAVVADSKVTVLLRGVQPEFAQLMVDGADAERLLKVLDQVECGRELEQHKKPSVADLISIPIAVERYPANEVPDEAVMIDIGLPKKH